MSGVSFPDMAYALALMGRPDEALPLLQQALPGARAMDDESAIANGPAGLGFVALLKSDCRTAEARFRESLEVAASFKHAQDQTLGIEWLAQSAAAQGRAGRATVLWGAADASRGTVTMSRCPCYVPTHAAAIAALRRHMGDAAFDAAYARGQAMTLEQAVAYALEESRG